MAQTDSQQSQTQEESVVTETVPAAPPSEAAPSDAAKLKQPQKTVVLLRKGDMRLGTVKKVLEEKGAFVDIGVGKDGFLPKRQFRRQFRFNEAKLEGFQASKFLKEGEEKRVWIHNLDRDKNDIILTLVRPDFKPIQKLQVGEKRHGYVQSVLDFGAFVDIGSDKDALLSVTRLSQGRIADIHREIKEGDEVDVWISEVRMPKGKKWQINVSGLPPEVRTIDDLQRGTKITGKVTGFKKEGALVDIQVGEDALLPVGEIAYDYIEDASGELEIGQELELLILRVYARRRHVEVSLKRLQPPPEEEEHGNLAVDEGPPLSAMELAFIKAQQSDGGAKKRKRKKSGSHSNREQEDIFARTLKSGA